MTEQELRDEVFICPDCGEECHRSIVSIEPGMRYSFAYKVDTDNPLLIGPWHCPNGCLEDATS